MAIGPSGWTRTTTSRVKSPACCVHTTKGSGANGGIRTRTSRLGRPAGNRYPTFASGSAYGYPVPPAGNAECIPPHPGRTWTGVAHRPLAIRQFSKTPLLRAWWAARDSNPIAPLGENGVTARQRTIRSYRPFGDSGRIRTRTREIWRLGCSRYTTLPSLLHDRSSETEPPRDLARALLPRVGPKQKGPLGIALEGLVLHECRAFRALHPPYRRRRRCGD